MATLPKPLTTTISAISAPARRKYLAAVARHDARMDGAFVYAVRSTGVYCRPSCPSRRPRADQILLFVQPDAAEQAGFRACRRCRPREVRESLQAQLVRRVCSEIEASQEGGLSLRN
jgi:AraC family transcriptional regulator of adaptative response/methylated-DNA-[protein]-cysteine methyltransferase